MALVGVCGAGSKRTPGSCLTCWTSELAIVGTANPATAPQSTRIVNDRQPRCSCARAILFSAAFIPMAWPVVTFRLLGCSQSAVSGCRSGWNHHSTPAESQLPRWQAPAALSRRSNLQPVRSSPDAAVKTRAVGSTAAAARTGALVERILAPQFPRPDEQAVELAPDEVVGSAAGWWPATVPAQTVAEPSLRRMTAPSASTKPVVPTERHERGRLRASEMIEHRRLCPSARGPSAPAPRRSCDRTCHRQDWLHSAGRKRSRWSRSAAKIRLSTYR